MALKPWYKAVTPREDLREGKPMDASEFAVHLDQVRDGRAPAVYQKPERFFERTYLTKGLTGVAATGLAKCSLDGAVVSRRVLKKDPAAEGVSGSAAEGEAADAALGFSFSFSSSRRSDSSRPLDFSTR